MLLLLAVAFLLLSAFLWCLSSKHLFYSWLKLGGESGFLVKIFTKQDKKLSQLLAEVLLIAKKKGFPPMKCFISKVNWLVAPCITNDYDGLVVHLHQISSHKIFVFSSSITGYSDDDLRILIAHEIGHCIDHETKRTGHPVFRRIGEFEKEEFANFISAYLYSKEMLFDSARRCDYKCQSLNRLKYMEITDTYSIK